MENGPGGRFASFQKRFPVTTTSWRLANNAALDSCYRYLDEMKMARGDEISLQLSEDGGRSGRYVFRSGDERNTHNGSDWEYIGR